MLDAETQKLAERIALFLRGDGGPGDDDLLLRASLEKINRRLDRIETQLAAQTSAAEKEAAAAARQSLSPHPSREKFRGLEELADEMTGPAASEKACPYEPTGKPCDHCAMCNSRGF